MCTRSNINLQTEVIAPPWIGAPGLAWGSMSWRMGEGETYYQKWELFLEQLAPDYSQRLDYLKAYSAAPMSFSEWVYHTLHPETEYSVSPSLISTRREELLALELLQADAAYRIWSASHDAITPWSYYQPRRLSPEGAILVDVKRFWLISRHLPSVINTNQSNEIDSSWLSCERSFQNSEPEQVDLAQGELFLAHRLCSRRYVQPPWHLNLDVREPTWIDSSTPTHYLEVFCHWCKACFEDPIRAEFYLALTQPSPEWLQWFEEHCMHPYNR